MLLQAIVLFACPVFLALGAATDVVSYRIPNWIPGAIIGLFVLAALVSGMPLPVLGSHALVFLIALLLGMALFAFSLIGGGDAKVRASVALWMGPAAIAKYAFAFAFVGGAFALVLLVARRIPLPAATMRLPVLSKLLQPTAGMPYGVALGIGALIVLPTTPLFVKALTP